ncbi:MAG: energy-coupling factor transporter transmembrane component T family protein [Syntrophomonadaceae bacterium]|jgi:energy-coupling factor transport system permease protein
MKDIITGQFIAGNSIIHRLDPRTKLLGCLVVIVRAAWPNQRIPMLLLNIGFIFFVIFLSEVGVVRALRGLKTLRWLFLITFICQALLTPGEYLCRWGVIAVTRQGVYLGISTLLRLTVFYLGSSLLTMTTSPLKLWQGLELLLFPLTHIKLPVHRLAIIANASLRFVPTIIRETEIIARAQKSRGARFDSGPLLNRLKTLMAILIPLLVASLRRANDMAQAMESRCYTGSSYNYSRGEMIFTPGDAMALGVITIVFLLPALYGWIN